MAYDFNIQTEETKGRDVSADQRRKHELSLVDCYWCDLTENALLINKPFLINLVDRKHCLWTGIALVPGPCYFAFVWAVTRGLPVSLPSPALPAVSLPVCAPRERSGRARRGGAGR